jgi:tRNA 2-thiouridine synthesizing protein B
MKLVKRSDDARLFLLGDGVYNILGKATHILPEDKIYACKEDLQARGISAEGVTLPEDFYGTMIKATMVADREYTL